VRESLGEDTESTLDWSRAGRRKIKGIDKPVALFRVRPEGQRGRGGNDGGDDADQADDAGNGE
jgi:class 3 adenylate cyclase